MTRCHRLAVSAAPARMSSFSLVQSGSGMVLNRLPMAPRRGVVQNSMTNPPPPGWKPGVAPDDGMMKADLKSARANSGFIFRLTSNCWLMLASLARRQASLRLKARGFDHPP